MIREIKLKKKEKLKKSEIVSYIDSLAEFDVSRCGKYKYLRFCSERLYGGVYLEPDTNGCVDYEYHDMRQKYSYPMSRLIRQHVGLKFRGKKYNFCPLDVLDKSLTNIANELFYMLPNKVKKRTDFLSIPRLHCKGRSRKDRYVPEFVIGIYQKKKKVIEQMASDGMSNMIPFILCFDLNQKNLRKKFGKGLWKALLKNTTKRNELLCKKLGITKISYLQKKKRKPKCSQENT